VAQAARMDTIAPIADDEFFDAVDTIVLAALDQIGNDPEARFRLFRRLLAVAADAAGGATTAPADADQVRPFRARS
jgi:hypothetical protein